MQTIDADELKKIQLELLDVVATYCEKNQIHYWLDSGTLIGAVRHHGYIPWDDDIDLGMLRPDYERFKTHFNESNTRYRFDCLDLNPDFHMPYGKVLDTETVLYEPDENGFKTSVNIDIFPYDNAPDDEMELTKMYDTRDRMRYYFNLHRSHHRPNGGFLRRTAVYVLRASKRIRPRNYYLRKMIENCLRFADQETERIGNFTGYVRFTANRHVFDSFIKMPFEGKLYDVPAGYDEWLREIYGDYMQLPPEEKRVSHHSFAAFRRESPDER